MSSNESLGREVIGATALYTSVIRERWRKPRFRGDLPGATVTAEDVNPLCGDRVRLALRLEGGAVAEGRFTGDSCAICSASADLLLERIRGRSVREAAAVTVEDLLATLEADIRPTRMKCVTLPLSVLKAALRAA